MKRLMIVGGALTLLVLLFCVSFLLFVTIRSYRPLAREPLFPDGGDRQAAVVPAELTLLTWNVGYAGLGAEADFFYDGGRMSRAASRTAVQLHLHNILSALNARRPDLCLLQEVDRRSSRSFDIDEYEVLRSGCPDRAAFFACNYRVPFVPVPLRRPMGGVWAGLLTFSRFRVGSGLRVALPGRFSWPTRLFMLRRCLLVLRLPLPGWGHELVVVNLHNSTFDEKGAVRRQELAFLRDFLSAESTRGNPVIVGGDWNHRLPGTDDRRFPASDPEPAWVARMSSSWAPPGWRWAVDPEVPTVRANSTPYRKGTNYRSVIDGFLVSPGVEIVSVRGIDLDFADSDHNPVLLRVRIEGMPR
jgi:endonuclease/exonuclease/phosphatase family metal-dependent hydrolase